MPRSFLNIFPVTGAALAIGSWLGYGSLAAPVSAAPNYFMRAWQSENGLPQNKVTSVVQTRDGYLWVGTYSGLARFDGMRFTVYDDKNTPEMHSSRVTSLFESGDGKLWVGHENGEVTTYQNGKFQPVKIRATWSGGKIYAITEDKNDDVWLLNESGLIARVRDGLVLSPETGTALKLLSVARTTNGDIWVARDGRMSELEHGQLHVFQDDSSLTNTYVQGICGSRDGGLWVSNRGRLRKWKGGKWTQDLGDAPWGSTPLTSMVEGASGVLLAATSNNGFFMMFPGTNEKPLHFNRVLGFHADWIISMMEDRENNLWIGTGGAGLIGLRPNNIQIISPPNRWLGRAVLSTYSGRDGALWVGTEGAGLYRLQHGEWSNFGFTNGIGNSYVWSIAEDTTGQLFAGTWGAGLFLRDGDRFKFAPGMENVMLPIPALLPARDGGLWAGTAAGLLHYLNGKTNWFTGTDGQPLHDVRAIAEATNGAVWFGTAGNGLACLENNHIRQFRQSNGLSSDYIECLHFDEDGALWVGTFGGGLCRLKDGTFSVIGREQGLPGSVIGDIEDDGNGFYWMSSHNGLIRASKVDLNNCADGKTREVHCLDYGVNDGLPTIECSEGMQPAGCKTPDGRLWFPTSKGLVVVDPNDVRINQLPPPMALEEVLLDGEPVTNTQTASALIIPPGHSYLQFNYTGLSFVAPEKVRFKYRIEGLEKTWVDAGTKRVAEYSFLPPGSYTFHVIACNNDGVWNETGVSLPFTLLPYFWQTLWFKILGCVAALAIGGGIMWYDTNRKMQFKLERIERQRALENERSRIARDIHDDLGATLTRITMISESVQDSSRSQQEAETDLKQIYDTARELTLAMDEIVWAVNPKHDTLESLANYLQQFAQDFLHAAGIRCRVEVPFHIPPWPMTAETRHNLFLAFKEALNNVVKHASASQVRISLMLTGPRAFNLSIEDDGGGFLFDLGAPANKSRGISASFSPGNGLENMTHRLAKIGGNCTIKSGDEGTKGTKVVFSVALSTG